MEYSSHRIGNWVSQVVPRWLHYFTLLLGAGSAAGQQPLLNYWFVYEDEESAALSRGESSRVLSVEGEKGEFCRAIYNDVRKHPLVLKARGDRQRMIRHEVQELSRGYQAAGMAPMEAYVNAWQEVDRRYRFNKHTAGNPAVKKLLERLASEGGEQPLSDAEVQQALQYLVADETRLELEEGRRLIELISRQLPQTSVNSEQQIEGVNDELMALFASALGHDIEGPQAFREAWFKLNRHRLVNHTLVGYRAPWGWGLGKQPHYRQAPQKVSTTVGSGNTQPQPQQTTENPQLTLQPQAPAAGTLTPDFTAGMNSSAGQLENFLATSPLLPEEEKQEDKEKDKETGLDEEDESVAVSTPPLPQQPMMMRSFSLRSAASPMMTAAADAGNFVYEWVSSGNATWQANNAAQNSPWGSQTATGNNPGVYENGYGVRFNDSSSIRNVTISGTVAPGLIEVNADKAIGSSGGAVDNPYSWLYDVVGALGSWFGGEKFNLASNIQVTLHYGYAFSGDGQAACIADVTDAQGHVLQPTQITSSGASMLVLDTANTYTGGTIISNGGLYLGCADAAGRGPITMHGSGTWTRSESTQGDANWKGQTQGSTVDKSFVGGELVISYGSDAPSYRTPSIDNSLIISGSSPASDKVYISFGNAFFDEPDDERLPAGSRYVSLNGGVYGAGNLYLNGFTYSDNTSDSSNASISYVSAFAINEKKVDKSLLAADCAKSFTGKVYFKNEFNSSTAAARHWLYRPLLGGAVQLVLEDDVFADAVINMTREQTSKEVGWAKSNSSNKDKAQTSDNILVLSGPAAIKGLDAGFRGKAWRHGSSTVPETIYATVGQESERWRVRVVSRVESTLTLNDDTTATHVYSGAMGFAQSYIQPGQEYVAEYNGTSGFEDASFTTSGDAWSNGKEHALKLTKQGQASQYIHSASLSELSLVQGTLGFNHLSLSGNLNLVGGSKLQLGVHADKENQTKGTYISGLKDELGVAWSYLASGDAKTTDTITLGDSQRLLVVAPDRGELPPTPANIDGNVTFSAGSSLLFYLLCDEPGISTTNTMLNVQGTLNLNPTTAISLQFDSVAFAKNAYENESTYYLAGADAITLSDNSSFVSQMVSLGYGYFGVLNVVTESDNRDYLTMSVVGDPRRTWSGQLESTEGTAGIWTHTSVDDAKKDSRWKEKGTFHNGHLVMFGNRYAPINWDKFDDNVIATDTTRVDLTKPGKGTLMSVTVDYEVIHNVEKVTVVGDVAPSSIVINADYYDADENTKIDDTNYWFYPQVSADGNEGYIRDVNVTDISETNMMPGNGGADVSNWKTSVRKMGLGTTIMELDNTYSGGTTIEGGRLVMKRSAALGRGSVMISNGAMLQGDFIDKESGSDALWNPYGDKVEGMFTSSIQNPVEVMVYDDPDEVDAYIANAHDKKLVIFKLSGNSDTVVTLYGTSAASGKYTYAVFKVLDPGEFQGTLKMDGNLLGDNVYEDLWAPSASLQDKTPGGKVQLEIMTTAKSATLSTGTHPDWFGTTIDLTVENGTERTVLALDAKEGAGTQIAEIASLHGQSLDGKRMNSSVVNMNHQEVITLVIQGGRNGDYDGVLGFGDFQKTFQYASTPGEIGEEKHHYGRAGNDGALNVHKLGTSVQSVNSAWLNELKMGDAAKMDDGGRFIVDKALVARKLSSEDVAHLSIGSGVDTSMYGLSVGAGGILAFDNDASADVLQGLGAGRPKTVQKVPVSGGNTGETKDVEIAPSGFVFLGNGATLSAYGDWYTNLTRTVSLKDGDTTYEKTIDVDMELALRATVTFNTHNYTPDEYISATPGESLNSDNDFIKRYNQSYVIQLLGKMYGTDVNLIFNNELISEAAQQNGSAKERADGLGYEGQTGVEKGYVVIRDIHQFTGDITVKDMTVLQVQNLNSSANASSADMEVSVTGENAAIQFVNGVKQQYMNQVTLDAGGHVLLGGTQKTGREDGKDHMSGVVVDITTRDAKVTGTMNDVTLKNDSANATLAGGSSTQAQNVDISTGKNLTVQNMELHNSLVQLKESASLSLADTVLVAADSVVQGAAVQNAVATAAELKTPPAPASAANAVSTTKNTTVQLTLTNTGQTFTSDKGNKVLVLEMNQFLGVNVTGTGLTLQLTDQSAHFLDWGYNVQAQYVAIRIGGGSGRFQYEDEKNLTNTNIDNTFVLLGADGEKRTGYWVTSTNVGSNVSTHMLYFNVPEPTTTTLSLAALAALAMRRRRRND